MCLNQKTQEFFKWKSHWSPFSLILWDILSGCFYLSSGKSFIKVENWHKRDSSRFVVIKDIHRILAARKNNSKESIEQGKLIKEIIKLTWKNFSRIKLRYSIESSKPPTNWKNKIPKNNYIFELFTFNSSFIKMKFLIVFSSKKLNNDTSCISIDNFFMEHKTKCN